MGAGRDPNAYGLDRPDDPATDIDMFGLDRAFDKAALAERQSTQPNLADHAAIDMNLAGPGQSAFDHQIGAEQRRRTAGLASVA
jgi:hypothetical protein